MKIFLSLILSALSLACASAPRNSDCEGAIEGVSIEYKGIERLAAWGRENSFGAFAMSNKAFREVKLPLDATYYPVIVHGKFIELQSRPVTPAALWELDTVVLEEFVKPQKWLVVGSGDGVTFFVDMAGPVSDIERSNAREYRVSLKDTSGCQYFSQSFRITN